MGKKSLTKSTTKKKSATKKKSTKARTTKAAAKAAAPKSGAKGKKPTLKSLIKRKFDAWEPEKLYAPKVDAAHIGNFTAPPAVAAANKKETERINALLTLKFDLSAPAPKKAPAKKATPQKGKKTEKPKKAQKKPEAKKPAKKSLSPAELLKLSFDSWAPDTLFTPQMGEANQAFTAPPAIDPGNNSSAEHIKALLARQFDLNAPPEPKAKPAPQPDTSAAETVEEKTVEVEKPAAPQEPVEPKEAAAPEEAPTPQPAAPVAETVEEKAVEPEKPAEPEPKAEPVAAPEKPQVEPAPELTAAASEKPAEKPAATTPPAESKTPEPEKVAEKAVKETPAPKAEPAKPEKVEKQPPKAEKPAAKPAKSEPVQKPAPTKTVESGGEDIPPMPPIMEKQTEPMPSGIKILIGCMAAIFAMLIIASISNMGNYYLKPNKNGLEILRGNFAPRGSHLYVSLPGTKAPATIKKVYTRAEALKPAFNYYMSKADALSEARDLIDFAAVKTYLNKAAEYAPTHEAEAVVGHRLDRINCLMLLFKADVAAAQKNAEGYGNAMKYLNQAAALDVAPALNALVKEKIDQVSTAQKELATVKPKPVAKPMPPVKPKKAAGEKGAASKTTQPKQGTKTDTGNPPATTPPAPVHH